MNPEIAAHILEWEEFLGTLTPENQRVVQNLQNFESFIDWAGTNSISDPFNLWFAREEYLNQDANKPEEENQIIEEQSGRPHRTRIHYHPPTHDHFEEIAAKNAEREARKWEEKPNPLKGKSRQGVYQAAHQKAYDNLVKYYPRLAEDWAKKHNDQNVLSAISRAEALKNQSKNAPTRTLPPIQIPKPTPSPIATRIPIITRRGPTYAITKSPARRAYKYNQGSTGVAGRINRAAGRRRLARRAASRASGLARDAKKARTLIGLGARAPWLITGGLIAFGVILVIFMIFAAGCVIVNNPLGDLFNVNYCKGGQVVDAGVRTPTPTPPSGGGGGGTLGIGEFKPPLECRPAGSKYYGLDYVGHTHWAVDFNRGSGADDKGDPVYAAADGIVEHIMPSNGEVWIGNRGDYMTAYAHMRVILVREFEHVTAGQKIGEIGDVSAAQPISPHLHYHICGHWLGCFVENTQVTIQVRFNRVPYPGSCYNCNTRGPSIDCNWP